MIGKVSFLFLFLTGVVLSPLTGKAQQDEVAVEITEIKADEVAPPSDASREKSRNSVLSDQWLKLDVKFSVDHTNRPKVLITDEIKFKFSVAALDALNRDEEVTLTGEISLVNVPDDKEHFVAMYLPPSSMVRYGGEKSGKNFFHPGATRDFNVHVEAEVAGKLAAEKDLVNGFQSGWHRLGKQVADVLIPFYESPWGPSERLRYNSYKSRSR
jgi:hypothetical protein